MFNVNTRWYFEDGFKLLGDTCLNKLLHCNGNHMNIEKAKGNQNKEVVCLMTCTAQTIHHSRNDPTHLPSNYSLIPRNKIPRC